MLHVLHFFFFFNDTATTEIYTLSLHDALPISISSTMTSLGVSGLAWSNMMHSCPARFSTAESSMIPIGGNRSEEHTSELQSRQYLVCRLLLEKKKINNDNREHL